MIREAYALRQDHSGSEIELAASLMNMGVLLRWKGEYAEAEQLIRQAVDKRKRLSGSESLPLAEAEFLLCWTLLEAGRVRRDGDPQRRSEFDNLIEHVLEVQRRELGSGHRNVGLTMTLKAMRMLQTGNRAEAIKSIQTAATVYMQDGGLPLVGRRSSSSSLLGLACTVNLKSRKSTTKPVCKP